MSCSTAPFSQSDSYKEIIEKSTRSVLAYDGIHNVLDAKVTLIRKDILAEQLNRKAQFFKWTEIKLREEREKMLQESSQETKVFLSFFTPDYKYDDLNKKKTLWHLTLEVDGRTFEPKIEKLTDSLVDIQSLYPYHTRWSTPYLLRFPVPVESLGSKAIRIEISSPLASKEFAFASESP